MTLKIRNGRLYGYKSVRVGRRVLTAYQGSGDMAVIAAILDREAAAERLEAQAAVRRLRAEATEARWSYRSPRYLKQ